MRVLGFLVCLLLVSPPIMAGGPILHRQVDPGEGTVVIKQRLDLWIEAPGTWELLAHSSTELLFRGFEGELKTEGILLAGNGPFQGSCDLELHCELPFAAGNYELELELALAGAQGLLGLNLAGGHWVLALNSPEAFVCRTGNGPIPLPDGSWFLLEPGDQLYFQGKNVSVSSEHELAEALGSSNWEVKGPLAWIPTQLHLEAGDMVEVTLALSGPAPASFVVLTGSPVLRWGQVWHLSGEEVQASGSGSEVVLALPALPNGLHELKGQIQAQLPSSSETFRAVARWGGQAAELPITVARSWFDFEHAQLIGVEGSSGPLILPDGFLTKAGGEVVMRGDRLDVLLPVGNLDRPIWTGLPLAEARPRFVTAGSEGAGPFVVPVLLWDRGFSWRVAAGAADGGWNGQVSPDFLRFNWGPLSVEGSPGTVFASLAPTNYWADGAYHWRRTAQGIQGSWQHGKWRWSVELPLGDGERPKFRASFAEGNLRLQLEPGDVRFQHRLGRWSWGGTTRAKTLWLEQGDGSFRLEISQKRLLLRFQPEEKVKLEFSAEPTRAKVAWRYHPWEGYIQSGAGGSELGLRVRTFRSSGNWLFGSRGALQLKSGLTMVELGQVVGYELASWCMLYGEGIVSLGFQVALRTDVGIVLYPIPQAVLAAGWDSQQGLHWKAGLVLPLFSRETAD